MARFTIEYEGDKNKVYSTNGKGETFAEILARRINRRGLMKGAAATGALVLTAKGLTGAAQDATPGATPAASPAASPVASPAATPGATPAATPASALGFEAIALDAGDVHIVANGYAAAALLKWGDPIFADAPEFDPTAQTAAARRCSSATTPTGLPTCPCRWAPPRPTTASWSSTTSTPTRS
jgi:secreted PhoX family phosphatase